MRVFSGDFPIKYIQTKYELDPPERQFTSGGVAQVVLVAGNKWRGGDLVVTRGLLLVTRVLTKRTYTTQHDAR